MVVSHHPDKIKSLHYSIVTGQIGDNKTGNTATMFADAFCKCRCGTTIRQPLDFYLHTSGRGECLYAADQRGHSRKVRANRKHNALDAL